MSNIKKQFKQDFESINNGPNDLSFDLTTLPENTRKTRHFMKPSHKVSLIISTSLATLVVSIIGLAIASSMRTNTSIKPMSRRYSINEIKIAESNSFKALNSVNYPNSIEPITSGISEYEEEAYNSFINSTYTSLMNANKGIDNVSYSAINLYSVLNELVEASSKPNLTTDLNNLLGLNSLEREAFYKKAIQANSYAKENESTQIRNSAFFTHELDVNQSYINQLTNLYCESFQLDFKNDLHKMVDYINQAVDSKNFVDEKFFDLQEDTVAYLLSTLYFKNSWKNKFITSNNIMRDFYLNNASKVTAKFMRHSYMTDRYYDFGKFIAFTDYYKSGSSITYYTPKDAKDNIHELIKDINIFDLSDKTLKDNNLLKTGDIMINLTMPLFSNKKDVDFVDPLCSLGFESMFDKEVDSFKNMFSGPKQELDRTNIYLQTIKQRNEVQFSNDGTVVKSVTVAGFGGNATAIGPNRDTLDIVLDSPFIYVIKDVNNVPLFIGNLDNPLVK